MYMKDFNTFVEGNKAILTIETDNGQYDENWLYSIDISKIWGDYSSNSISVVDFNNEYAALLMEHQQNISSSVGDACWDEIALISDELRGSTNEKESETVYNKLYDVFDRFEIYINTGKIENNNEISA